MWKRLEQRERDEEEQGLVGGCESGEGGVSGEVGRQVHKSTLTITFKHSQATPVHPTFKVCKLKMSSCVMYRAYRLSYTIGVRGKGRGCGLQ